MHQISPLATKDVLDQHEDFLPDLCSVQSVLVLIVIGELLAFTLTIAHQGLNIFEGTYFGMASFLVQWIILTSAGVLCALKNTFRQLNSMAAGMVSFLIILLLTFIFSVFAQWYVNGKVVELAIEPVCANLIIAAIFAGIGLRYCYIQQQLRYQQKAELMARVQALQARIRPHFLFNSLNSIASLILFDPKKAERMVVDLADLFRSSLKQEGLVSLKQEIVLCKKFISIEKIRMGDRLKVEWHGDVTASVGASLLPSLTLQPLIENGIYHGVQPLTQGGTVTITITFQGQQVMCNIRNPKPLTKGNEMIANKGNGIALKNIRRRLNAYYGDKGGLSVEESESEYSVDLYYPIDKFK